MKKCTKCKEKKPLSEFRIRLDRKSGVYPSCKKCKSIEQSKRYRAQKKQDPIKSWVSRNYSNTKNRAKQNNLIFSLVKEQIIDTLMNQHKKCIYCKKDFNFHGTSTNRMDCPTLDKIIPSLGYTQNNVVIACYRCNAIKNDATHEELNMISTNLKRLVEDRIICISTSPSC